MRLKSILERQKSGQRAGQGKELAFTLIELLVVITIIGILSALVVGASRRAIQAKTIKRVQAELQNLTTAINSYHNTYNQYPPDNTNSPFLNPLFYELVGTTYSTVNSNYSTPGSLETVSLANVNFSFRIPGLLNTSSATDVNDKESPKAKQFLNFEPKDHKPIVNVGGAELLVVPAGGTLNSSQTNSAGELFNLWGYSSTNPTNNTKSFDLWAEVVIGGTNSNNPTNIIGNWSADVIVK